MSKAKIKAKIKSTEVNKIHKEYQKSNKITSSIKIKTVVFYGGSILGEDTKIYQDAKELAIRLGSLGWGIITGGGQGVMKAGQSGADMVSSPKISFKMKSSIKAVRKPTENEILVNFDSYAPRKHALRQGDVHIYFSGGIGTLDELMENLNLMKTKKEKIRPTYLYGSTYWSGLIVWLETVVVNQLGNSNFLKLFKVVDSVDEIIADLEK
jgi:uncharacterized protein (TIGR00730 family)